MLRVRKSNLRALAAAATLASPFVSLGQENQSLSGTWTFNGGGLWSVSTNWAVNAGLGTNAIANNGGVSSSARATFPFSSLSTDAVASISMDSNRSLGRIEFTGAFLGNRAYSISGGSLTLNNNINNTTIGDVTINTDSGKHTIAAVILSVGAGQNVIKEGPGTLVLSGANTFSSAAIQISNGRLIANGLNTLRSAVSVATANGSVLELSNTGSMGTVLIGLGSAGAPNGAIQLSAGSATIAGIGSPTAPVSMFLVQSGTANIAATASLTLTGGIFDSAEPTLNGFTKTGTGTFAAGAVGINGTLTNTAGQFNVNGTQTSSVNTLLINAGTFAITNGTFTVTNPLNVGAGAAFSVGTALFNGVSSLTSATGFYNITAAGRVTGNKKEKD